MTDTWSNWDAVHLIGAAMSRDEIAVEAMKALIIAKEGLPIDAITYKAYKYADSMLEARDKKDG